MANNELQVIYTANTKAFERSARKVKKELNGFEKTASNLGKNLAGVFAVGAVVQLGRSIVSTTAKFQRFEAVLTKTLGSKSEAQSALRQITQFASKTPFQVDDLTDSFVKLANQGFKPTINQMRQLGDLAASQGKSFNQLSEAILDAQVGEFERLKEFGIRASKQGDKVTFAFKGVEKQVNFSSDAIQGYILGLGDVEGVSGGMVAISETLGGKISNLNDNWEQLKLTMGQLTSGESGGVVGFLSDVVSNVNLLITGVEKLQELQFEQLLNEGAKNGVKQFKTYIATLKKAQGSTFDLASAQKAYLDGLISTRNAIDENMDAPDQVAIERRVKLLDDEIAAIRQFISLKEEEGKTVVEATKAQKTILEKLDESLRLVTASEGVLGTEYTRTAERISLYQKALIALKASQDPHIESINAVSDALERQQGLLKEAPDALTGEGLAQPNIGSPNAPKFEGGGAEVEGIITTMTEAQVKAMEFRRLMEGVGESVGLTFENIGTQLADMFNGMIQEGNLTFKTLIIGLGRLIAKLLIATGIAAAFRAILGDPTAPARGAQAIGAVASSIGGLVGAIPQLAEGGVTNGPTLAMIGEGKEQEAVLPLSKLAGLMSGGFGINSRQSSVSTNSSAMSRVSSNNSSNSSAFMGNVKFRLEGNDLVGSIQRTFKNNGSSGGAVSFG